MRVADDGIPPLEDSFRLGEWRVEPARRLLIADDHEHMLEPRVMDLLLYLAARPGQVIGTEQLLADIWGGTFYGDSPVQRAIALLRRGLGDRIDSPRYIETIRKRGYRLIAAVIQPLGHPQHGTGNASWTSSSPFPGLAAFGSEHAPVFFGRSRATSRLLEALAAQRRAGGCFVLLVGSSGCGKTSLLRAGVLPALTRAGGADEMQVASSAWVDFRATSTGSALSILANALCGWSMEGRKVFADSDRLLAAFHDPDDRWMEDAVAEAMRRRAPAARRAQPDPLLFATLDHAEALADAQGLTEIGRATFAEVLRRLAALPEVAITMVCRSDIYPALIDCMPVIAELKLPEGHFDLLPPTPGELAEIIRRPAQAAGLAFEREAETSMGLDDVLRDTASGHPECLPVLQYVLQGLYEDQRPPGVLSFSVYRSLGGLGGALSQRAEAAFCELPAATRAMLPSLLGRLIRGQERGMILTSRRIASRELDTPAERALAEHLVAARLLSATLIDGEAQLEIAHEALLREWKRVREWALDNQRLLHAQARLRFSARRWEDGERRHDLLLQSGLPLAEAIELAASHRIFWRKQITP